MAEPEQQMNYVSLLPPELLAKIFGMLTVPEKARCAAVCRDWCRTMYTEECWRDVTCTMNYYVKQPQFRFICKQVLSRRIRGLALNFCQPMHRRMDVCYVKLITHHLKHLIHLTLCEINKSDEALLLIARHLPGLLSLQLPDQFGATDTGIGYLAGQGCDGTYDVPHLEYLRIGSGKGFSDDACRHLSVGQPHLKHLHLFSNSTLTNTGLMFVSRLTKLEKLNIRVSFNDITDAGLEHLVLLTNLQVLYLGLHKRVIGSGFRFLKNILSLRELHLPNFVEYSSYIWGSVSLIPNLRHLSYCGPQLTDADLYILCHEKSRITKLEIGCHYGITDDGLEALSLLPELECLHLVGCVNVRGRGIFHLTKKNYKLSILNLSGCCELYQDKVLPHISGMKNLRSLIWPDHIKLTDDQLIHFAELCPLLQITTYSED